MRSAPTLAFDRASVRRTDVDGHLHVETANISKANICSYYGREVPGWQALGLDAERVYHMLRHPDELAKAAATFNGKPVLDLHTPVSADDHPSYQTVGSVGSNTRFEPPYLVSSLSVWVGDSIRRIETGDQRELSCGYRYRADMTPGNFEGSAYDGIMRDIVGNHVALVPKGRAGPDVVIGDSRVEMPKMLKSRRALMVSGSIAGLVKPMLAADAKLDLEPALSGLTAANLHDKRVAVAGAVVAAIKPLLAADKTLDEATVLAAIDAVAADAKDDKDDAIAEPVVPPTPAPSPSPAPAVVPNAAPIVAPTPAPTPAPAMDAATIRADTIREMNAVRTAEREVHPHIGELATLPDTAAGVYKLALDAAKVDLTDVPPAAYGAMVRMLPKPGEQSDRAAPLATDAASVKSASKWMDETFPTRSQIKRA